MEEKLHIKGKLMAPEGYFTAEATLVILFVFYVCISVVYLGFFQYDRCLMRQDAYRAALRGSSVYKDDKYEVYNTVNQVMKELDSEKYVATGCDYKITVADSVQVQVSGGVRMPFRGIMAFLGTVEWSIFETAESKCINPVTFIRLCRQLGIGSKE